MKPNRKAHTHSTPAQYANRDDWNVTRARLDSLGFKGPAADLLLCFLVLRSKTKEAVSGFQGCRRIHKKWSELNIFVSTTSAFNWCAVQRKL